MADISQSGSYTKIVKPQPKASWAKRIFEHWSRAWYFERLLVFLSVVAMPFIACYLVESLVGEMALKLETDHFAADLMALRLKAKENSSFGYLITSSPQSDAASFYDLWYSKQELGRKRVYLPSGFTVLGRIVFDPLGVPDSAINFAVRHGLRVRRVHVDSQGFVGHE